MPSMEATTIQPPIAESVVPLCDEPGGKGNPNPVIVTPKIGVAIVQAGRRLSALLCLRTAFASRGGGLDASILLPWTAIPVAGCTDHRLASGRFRGYTGLRWRSDSGNSSFQADLFLLRVFSGGLQSTAGKSKTTV